MLGVEPNATPEEIQRAYREKANKHHPDKGGDAWAFQQVQDAYIALTNPKPAEQRNPASDQRDSTANSQAGDSQGNASHPSGSKTQPKEMPTTSQSTRRVMPAAGKDATGKPQTEHNWKNLFVGQLPLQTETTAFIFVNCLDIFLTYIVIRFGGMEANPIANYFTLRWGFYGAIGFKLAIVAIVTVIAQIVAIKKMESARFLLIAGTVMVGCVLVYSVFLFMKHFGSP